MILRPITIVIQLQNETIYKQSKDEIDLKFMVIIENNLFENCFIKIRDLVACIFLTFLAICQKQKPR